jgi:hypothetical protein
MRLYVCVCVCVTVGLRQLGAGDSWCAWADVARILHPLCASIWVTADHPKCRPMQHMSCVAAKPS